MSLELQRDVRRWASKQHDEPALAAAIRRLVEIGLSAPSSSKRAKVLSTSSESAARAAELAAKVIDKRLVAAPPADRVTRKRKLVEGPSIVRGIRKDQS